MKTAAYLLFMLHLCFLASPAPAILLNEDTTTMPSLKSDLKTDLKTDLNSVPNTPHPVESNISASLSQALNETMNSLECDACTFIANKLNTTVFHNPKLLSLATTELDNICSVLPASVHDACLAAVQTAVPVALDKIGDYVAEEGCVEVGICKS